MEKYLEANELPARIFAIGDIHGCVNELDLMLEYLERKQNLSSQDVVVFIGDYVDRGPDSKPVLETLRSFQQSYPASIFLKGNHEEMLLSFLGFEGSEGQVYLLNGGTLCLQSYQIDPDASPEEILNQFPKTHLSFLLNLARYYIVGDFVFVHAGLNPLRDLRSQLDQDIYWIRDEFIKNIHHFEKTVVFGHTPYKNLLLDIPYKIGIDTGLVYGNRLSCIELVEKQGFQIKRGQKRIKAFDLKP